MSIKIPVQQKKQKWNRVQKMTLMTIALVNFSASTCFALQAPFFPREAEKKGASHTAIGMVFGAFSFVILISSLIFGKLITRVGAKFMFCCGLFVVGNSTIMFGFMDLCPGGWVFVGMCIAVRSVEGLGCSMAITANSAIVASLFPGEVGLVMGFVEATFSLGFTVGPVIGGSLYEVGGFKLPFLVMGSLMLVIMLLALVLLPTQNDNLKKERSSFLKIIQIPSVIVTCTCVTIAASLFGFLDPNLSPFVDKKFKLSAFWTGFMFMALSIAFGVSSPATGWIVDNKGLTKSLMIVGQLIASVAMFFMGPSSLLPIPSMLWLTVVSLIILGIGAAVAEIPAFQDLLTITISHGLPDNFETYGILSGILNSCLSAGSFIGPLLGGYLDDIASFQWATTCMAGLLVFSASIMLVFKMVNHCKTSNSADYVADLEREPLRRLNVNH